MRRFLLALLLILSLLASACAGQTPANAGASTVEPIPSPTNPAPAFTASLLYGNPKIAPEYADKLRYDIAVPTINVWKILASFTAKAEKKPFDVNDSDDATYLNDMNSKLLEQSIKSGTIRSSEMNGDELDVDLAINSAFIASNDLTDYLTKIKLAKEYDRIGLAGDARKTKDDKKVESVEYYQNEFKNSIQELVSLEGTLRGYLAFEEPTPLPTPRPTPTPTPTPAPTPVPLTIQQKLELYQAYSTSIIAASLDILNVRTITEDFAQTNKDLSDDEFKAKHAELFPSLDQLVAMDTTHTSNLGFTELLALHYGFVDIAQRMDYASLDHAMAIKTKDDQAIRDFRDQETSLMNEWTTQGTILKNILEALKGGQEPSEINYPTISRSEYDKLQTGISYADAWKIVGGQGKLLSESGLRGTDTYFVTYVWLGEGEPGAQAVISFWGDELTTKAQSGLREKW